MKLLCTWCRMEGKPGYLGEREPLEDEMPTHGICPDHQQQVLSRLPSKSFPDVVLLLVIRRDDPALYQRLRLSFAGAPYVKVIVDRRVGDRRSSQTPVNEERRHTRTRRIRKGTVSAIGGYTVVRFSPKRTNTMPSGTDAMEGQALRTLIRTKLKDGHLPIGNAPRVWGGTGQGETCAACETPITENQLAVEGVRPAPDGGIPIVLHVKCFQIWAQERCALKWSVSHWPSAAPPAPPPGPRAMA
jgi:hypothetical protein